jgi:alpha-N-arabinofuranosidase
VHQDATLSPTDVSTPNYTFGTNSLPSVSVSTSKDAGGKLHVSLCNLDPNKAQEVTAELLGAKVSSITGRILAAATMQAHNTFDALENVKPAPFSDATPTATGFTTKLPPKSVVVLELN